MKPWHLVYCLFLPCTALAQEPPANPEPVYPAVNYFPGSEPGKEPVDPSLTTHETGIDCALSQIAQKAGEHHKSLNNATGVAFKSGLCAGRVQTYMLQMQIKEPACFPKIDLQEGISMFVKWADTHPEQGSKAYLEGFTAAFEDAVPCLKK